MIIIKVTYHQDTRRMAVEKYVPNVRCLSKFGELLADLLRTNQLMAFSVLKQVVKNMFPAFQQSSTDISIKYKDDEGDMISITTDFELEEALRQSSPSAQQEQVLRLTVDAVGAVAQPAVSSSELLPFSISEPIVELPKPIYPVIAEPVAAPVPVAAAPSAAPASSPAAPLQKSVTRSDLPVLQMIELQLADAMKTIAAFMESLHINQKMTELISDIHLNMKKATVAAQENVLTPLSAMTKSKAAIASDHLEKLKQEISKLKAMLEVEFGKAIDKITQLATPAKNPTEVELKQVPVPAATAAPVQPVAQPAAVPAPVVTQLPVDPVAQLVEADLQKLADMGFNDRPRNLELLRRYNGDLMAIVEQLLA